jgi:AcrR family transcriptional regulator
MSGEVFRRSAMPIGRPREFDEAKALDRAMEVFWRRGFEGATLPELTAAMGINRPSLYAAFGNKEALFRKVVERYLNGPGSYIRQALEQPTAREVIEGLLAGTINLLTRPGSPHGCLMVQGALACGEEGESVRQQLVSLRTAGFDLIRQRLESAKLAGELPVSVDCADLARFVATVTHGLAVQAASGATRRQLQRVAEIALRAWPQ